VTLKISWKQALAWRMERQLLDPVGRLTVAGVVRRLGGVQTQVASSAELAVRLRRKTSRRGEVARALTEGRLIKTWAMRGTLHLLTPEDGGAFLSLIAAGRSWETPAWERYFGLGPKQIEGLRHVVREALEGKVLTREELIAAVTAQRGLGHVGEALRSGWGTLLKPLAWQGDLCFGPSRGTRVTFMLPEAASSRWAGVPDPDEAAPTAIAAYFGAYGPATIENFRNWISRGRVSVRRIRSWFGAMSERLTEIDVDGERRYVLSKDVDEMASATPSSSLRLLPGFDQYVLGPGTEDHHVIPAKRRAAVSKQAGWIAPIVVYGGVVSGTWELDGDDVRVAWFKEAGKVPRSALEAEVTKLATIQGRGLNPTVRLA
jgi:hypothetical protein